MHTMLYSSNIRILLAVFIPFLLVQCGSEELVTDNDFIAVAWRLTEISGNEPGITADPIELTLDGKKQMVSGFGGCNRFSGSYTQEEDELSFGPIAATKMYCEEVMSIEDAFFASLSNVSRAVVEGTSLTMFDENGARILSFEKGS